MNRVVLILDTGNPNIVETAQWFLKHQDSVLLGVSKIPETRMTGVEYIDLSTEGGLQRTAEETDLRYGRLDILVLGAFERVSDGMIGTGHDYERFNDILTRNVVLCRNMIEIFRPLLEKGMKRIACITEAESSNSWSTGADDLTYAASLAAINMLGRMMFNKLRPEGFTFRWYCETNVSGGMCAAEYIASSLCYDPKEPYTHSDENRFVMRDAYLREISW